MSNWLAGSFPVRYFLESRYDLDRRRRPPTFARSTFLDWWQRNRARYEKSAAAERSRMALFADTFTNYHEPEIPIAAVELAAAAGWSVAVAPRVCCGRGLISKGFLEEARERAEQSVAALLPLVERGLPIVFVEPGCFSAVRDDHPHLLRGELQKAARRVAEACVTFEEWAQHANLLLRQGPERVLLHAHCHQKALVGTGPAMLALAKIPGCQVVDLDAGCCGMAGSFGYEREHYDISKAIGERKLFGAVREADTNSMVVASGFSCRHQVAHFTQRQAVHPAVALRSLLDGSA
jgi:Fe-S oxidoreductase